MRLRHLLLRWWGGRPALWKVAGIAVCAFIWDPLLDEFIIGQLNTLLLLLLTGAWLALRKGRGGGGVLLGVVLSLKLMAWPIIIFLALRRDWRAAGTACVTTTLAHLVAAAAMGCGAVADYYVHVGAAVAGLYRAHGANFSAWSVGWRLFQGVSSSVVWSVTAPPLIYSPGAARVVSYALPAALLGAGLLFTRKAKHFDTAFAALICVSILVSPITWSHYLILAAIPLAVMLRSLLCRECPRGLRLFAIATGLVLLVPRLQMERFASFFATNASAPGQSVTVPFAAGLLTLLPAAGVLALLFLIVRLDPVCGRALKS